MQNHVLVNLFNANGLRPERAPVWKRRAVGARSWVRLRPAHTQSRGRRLFTPGRKKRFSMRLGCLRNETEYVNAADGSMCVCVNV